MQFPDELVELFKQTNYYTHPIAPRTDRLCRTILVMDSDPGSHDSYPTSNLYNVLQYLDGEIKKADAPFAEFAGDEEARFWIALMDWLQQVTDKNEYSVSIRA